MKKKENILDELILKGESTDKIVDILGVSRKKIYCRRYDLKKSKIKPCFTCKKEFRSIRGSATCSLKCANADTASKRKVNSSKKCNCRKSAK